MSTLRLEPRCGFHQTEKTSGLLEALAITGLSVWLGAPIPPTIAKSVFRSVSTLVGSTTDRVKEWIDGSTRVAKAKSDLEVADLKARAAVIKGTVPIALEHIAANPELAERATAYLGDRVLREQATREEVVAGAIAELKADPPKEDSREVIDDDWLNVFSRAAETRTSEEAKAYLSKILAGEIRKPGSFSPATIEALSRLSRSDAALFQHFCGMVIDVSFLLAEPYGAPGNNALTPVGLSYGVLGRLQDAGLLRPDITAFVTAAPLRFSASVLAGRRLLYAPRSLDASQMFGTASAAAERPQAMKTLFMTVAGQELCQIVNATPDEAYIAKFTEWMARFDLLPLAQLAAEMKVARPAQPSHEPAPDGKD